MKKRKDTNVHVSNNKARKLYKWWPSALNGRKSTATTIDAGAGVVSDAITELKRDLADF
jgi:hypothetical protein